MTAINVINIVCCICIMNKIKIIMKGYQRLSHYERMKYRMLDVVTSR